MSEERCFAAHKSGNVRVWYRAKVRTGDRLEMDLAAWGKRAADGTMTFARMDLACWLFDRFVTRIETRTGEGDGWKSLPYTREGLFDVEDDGAGFATRLCDALVEHVGLSYTEAVDAKKKSAENAGETPPG